MGRSHRAPCRLIFADVTPPIIAGFQRWRALLFVHWEVPRAALRALLPAALEIDTFQDRAYVGLIPFAIPEARPPRPLPPVPTAASFLETNLRTYVKANGLPGIWFFSLEAASSLAVLGARAAYGLPYHRATMTSTAADGGTTVTGEHQIRYRSHRRWPGPRPADLQIDYSVGAPIGTAVAGTLEHFLIERYTLFVQRRGLGLMRANVRHAPYPLQRATVHAVDETLTRAAGLLALGRRAPDLFSPGVDVDIGAPERVR
jgi:uncharacterized protein